MFTQGFISGFALIPPWALQDCRACALIMRLNFDALALGFRAEIYKKVRPRYRQRSLTKRIVKKEVVIYG